MRQNPANNKQRGLVMIAMLLLAFMVGTSMYFMSVSDRHGDIKNRGDTNKEMVQIKQALITYAANYADLYPGAIPSLSKGPGHLPCPDTDMDGLPEDDCDTGEEMTYRLPMYAETETGGRFYFSRHFIEGSQEANPDIDYSQFWYALSPGYATSDIGLNSSVAGTLELDSRTDYVALIIAPGEPVGDQNRASEANRNDRDNYLEAPNDSTDTGVFANYAENADNPFNEQIIGITRNELMAAVTMRVAREVKKGLDDYHDGSAYPDSSYSFWIWNYPEWQYEFQTAMDDALGHEVAHWYANDDWDAGGAAEPDSNTVITYKKINNDRATLKFNGYTDINGCNIQYVLNYSSEPSIARVESTPGSSPPNCNYDL